MTTTPFNLGPISKDLLYIKIVDAINAYIRANNLQPGDKLPSEREMAEIFQTSRNSVREALRVLENQNMIEVKTGRGTFLKDNTAAAGSFSIELIKSSFREIQELAVAIETACLAKAIARGSDEQKRYLLAIAKEMSQLGKRGVFSEERDHAFHSYLADMSGNGTMIHLLRKLREDVYAQYWSCLDYDKSLSLETIDNHVRLAQAIVDGDEAKAMAEVHIIHEHTLAIVDRVSS